MKLKELRKKNNITQKDIALKIGITDKTYANYENNKTEPPIETLIKLADYFHITIDELVGREYSNFIDKGLLNNIELDTIEKMRKLDRDNQLRLQTFVFALLQNQKEEEKTTQNLKQQYPNATFEIIDKKENK